MDNNYEIKVFNLDKDKDNTSESIFPTPIRCLIIGSSGSGKTNLLSNIIINYWVPFDNLYIFTKKHRTACLQKNERSICWFG